jgi:universal stress protein A
MNGKKRQYGRLLATVELGETADRVLTRAVDLGRRCGAELDLASILEGAPSFLVQAVSSGELEEILDKGSRWSRERLEEIKAREPGISAVHVGRGILAEEVRDLVGRIDADLLVVGAHDRRGFAALFRDRSDEILHRAPCDVLIVKKGGPAPPYRHLLVAVDLDERETRVVERAALLAELLGTELTLMHVIEHFPVDRSNRIIPPEDQDPLTFEREQTVARLCEIARAAGSGNCRQELAVSASTASREVPAFAAARGVDLIVTGSHGRHGLGRLLGSTADGIVHRASCDVLVVRQPVGA